LSSAIKLQAMEMGLPIFQPERIREDAALSRIEALTPDLMVVVAYGQILPARLIEMPRLGTLNVHASLLPRHRGPAPIEWAILNGDRETGVTIMQMDAGVDTGPILSQRAVSITPDETAQQLEDRLAHEGARLLVETIDHLRWGDVKPVPQPAEGVSHAARLKSQDGKLDPTTMTAASIDRRVRALSQRIGTWMRVNGVDLKILRGHLDGSTSGGIPVQTVGGTYVLDEVQPSGGRPMSAAAWMRGRH
jgi:methionyl-tRNA formyltransferase